MCEVHGSRVGNFECDLLKAISSQGFRVFVLSVVARQLHSYNYGIRSMEVLIFYSSRQFVVRRPVKEINRVGLSGVLIFKNVCSSSPRIPIVCNNRVLRES